MTLTNAQVKEALDQLKMDIQYDSNVDMDESRISVNKEALKNLVQYGNNTLRRLFIIEEILIEESKEHFSAEESISKIRSILRN